MKVEITRHGFGSKIIDKNGHDIAGKLGVNSISVRAGVDGPTEIELTMLALETVVAEGKPRYYIPGVGYVKGVILEDGTKTEFPED